MSRCVEHVSEGLCEGEISEGRSRSGATFSERCEAGWESYNRRMDKVEQGLQERYPGYDVPGSVPPSWFDPSYAGESWDED